MKNLTIVTLIFSFLLISANIYAQITLPLELNNRWIFDGENSRITAVDTNYVIDSITYCRLSIQNTAGVEYTQYVRLNDSGYYAVRLDTSYPAPNHELLYFKKNAVIGDSWINPGEYFPMVYTKRMRLKFIFFNNLAALSKYADTQIGSQGCNEVLT